MVEEATKKADEYLQEKREQNAAPAERIQAEQERIVAGMDTVRGRDIGPIFTQGMRDNLLRQLHDKLTQLMSTPQAYFGEQ